MTTVFIVTPYTYKQNVIARLLVDAAKAAGTKHIVHLGVSQPEKSLGDYMYVKQTTDSRHHTHKHATQFNSALPAP